MKLFPGKVGIISAEITKVLVDEGDLETDSPSEVELDVESVLKEYIRTDRDLTEKAKDICESKGIPFTTYIKIKRKLADQRRFVLGDEAIDYIMEQLIRTFMNSQFVEEIYSEDHELKVKMRTVLRRHTEIEDDIDAEARTKIKNLEEGTRDWEIEYARAMAQVKKRRGLI
ncbi:MAG: DUF507 family protein [Deltaproteobacteria bacterium]|nr:DUF507 family protein [Deltaproteobacteria bacterium]